MGRVDGKVALITGGASGMGKAFARKLHGEGAKVVIADINAEAGKAVAADLREGAIFVELDVTSDEAWASAVKATLDNFGDLNVMVLAAGISVPTPIEDMDLGLWQAHMDINVTGVMLGGRNGIPAMKKGGNPGSIVLISSTQGSQPVSAHVAYAASKAAVISMAKSFAKHCAESGYNIRVNAIQPGAIQTPMLDSFLDMAADREAALAAFGSAHPMNRVGRPEEVANAVLFLASDESSYVTGASLPVDGGFLA
ncbi:MAG: glucose 1-dehydrogenase [Proteobacteria bacterium]|nr:glucose 1-dehydrogenase [Pseudomonadota bacterium]